MGMYYKESKYLADSLQAQSTDGAYIAPQTFQASTMFINMA